MRRAALRRAGEISAGDRSGQDSLNLERAEYICFTQSVNADPFGATGGAAFHLHSHLQEFVEHHGTYDENRQQLLNATMVARPQYHLKTARIEPAAPGSAENPAISHAPMEFQNMAACVSTCATNGKTFASS
jgi:hypothetical protein